MTKRLFDRVLNSLKPEDLTILRPAGLTRAEAMSYAASAPSNQDVLDACRGAYSQHSDAVDGVTFGSVQASRTPALGGDIAAMHQYNWNSKLAAPQLASPIYDHPVMGEAKMAVQQDGSFGLFFLGVQMDVDVFLGAEGGAGIGFPFPGNEGAIWMAYGGFRLALNIDVAININAGIFVEPPDEVAGDFLGLEVSAEPVAEGPEVSFGIHMSPDLSKVRGFSFGIGVALSLIPVTGAVVFGSIATSATEARSLWLPESAREVRSAREGNRWGGEGLRSAPQNFRSAQGGRTTPRRTSMMVDFGSVLSDAVKTARQVKATTAASSNSPPFTNQQIIQAAQAAYTEHQSAVDAMTQALVNTLNDPTMADAIASLDGTNWASSNLSTSLADPFFADTDVKTFIGTARQTTHDLQSVSVGVFSSQLPNLFDGGPGMVGFVRDLAGSNLTGAVLQLDILKEMVSISQTGNLQYALWVPPSAQIHDLVTGLYVCTTYQNIPVILKVLLTSSSLQPYGFAVSSGTKLNLPLSTGVFSGSTSQWQPT